VPLSIHAIRHAIDAPKARTDEIALTSRRRSLSGRRMVLRRGSVWDDPRQAPGHTPRGVPTTRPSLRKSL